MFDGKVYETYFEDNTEDLLSSETSVTSGGAVSFYIPEAAVYSAINDIHLIAVFAVLTFCKSCIRAWRERTVKNTRG